MMETIISLIMAFGAAFIAVLFIFAPHRLTRKYLDEEKREKVARGLRIAGWIMIVGVSLVIVGIIAPLLIGR